MRKHLIFCIFSLTLQAGDWLNKVIPAGFLGVLAGIGITSYENQRRNDRLQHELDEPQKSFEQNNNIMNQLKEHHILEEEEGKIYVCNPLLESIREIIIQKDTDAKAALLSTLKYARKKFNINAGDRQGNNPLHIAARCGNIESIEILLNHNAEINRMNIDGETPLVIAIKNKTTHFSQRLETIKKLLESKPDISLSDSKGMNALHYAAQLGARNILRMLAEHCPDCKQLINNQDKTGCTPLHAAVRTGHLATIQLLLHLEANPNVQDNQGMTALHYAAKNGYENIVEELIKAGASLNVYNNNKMLPIMLAKKESIQQLISRQPDALNLIGTTLMHDAAQKGNLTKLKEYIKQGANINVKNAQGQTPLMIALIAQKKETVEYILSLKKIHNEGRANQDVEYLAHHMSALHMCLDTENTMFKDKVSQEKSCDMLVLSLSKREIDESCKCIAASSSGSCSCTLKCPICCENIQDSHFISACCSNIICHTCPSKIDKKTCPWCCVLLELLEITHHPIDETLL